MSPNWVLYPGQQDQLGDQIVKILLKVIENTETISHVIFSQMNFCEVYVLMASHYTLYLQGVKVSLIYNYMFYESVLVLKCKS